MSKIIDIYSLKTLHDMLEKYTPEQRKKLILYLDLDLTIIMSNPANENEDILIEEDVTKELFKFLTEHEIYFTMITARFHDTICNARKRNLSEVHQNLTTTIFPVLEQLGLDIESYKNDDKFHPLKNEHGKTVGVIYKGIILGAKKGEIIKHYRKEFGLEKSHPITIFIDDHDTYLKNVEKHVEGAVILRRNIKE